MKYYQLTFLLLISLSFLTVSNGLRKKRLSPPAPCPDGSSPVRCFVNPCQTSTCDVEGATCRANFCGGCKAIWYKDNKKVDCHSRPITEAPPPKASPSPSPSPSSTGCNGRIVNCFVDPCQTSTCDVAGAECRSNYCNGCNAEWFLNNKKITCQSGPRTVPARPRTETPSPTSAVQPPAPLTGGRCPGGFRPANCFVDPCQISSCSAEFKSLGAICRADYCKGCSAEWFVNGEKVTCKADEAPAETPSPSPTSAVQPPAPLRNGLCPGGFRPANCFVDPCQISRCSIAGAECRADYCKGCGAEWFLNGQKVDCDLVEEPTEEDTPHEADEEKVEQPAEVEQGGEEEEEEKPKCNKGFARCFVDPCLTSQCDVDGAECRSNYCGGCFADWYLNNKKIDCKPKASPSPCANPVRCLVNPCQFAKCGIAGAKCKPNYCGGCNAEWFLNNDKVEC